MVIGFNLFCILDFIIDFMTIKFSIINLCEHKLKGYENIQTSLIVFDGQG
jgi:hypothetical protein